MCCAKTCFCTNTFLFARARFFFAQTCLHRLVFFVQTLLQRPGLRTSSFCTNMFTKIRVFAETDCLDHGKIIGMQGEAIFGWRSVTQQCPGRILWFPGVHWKSTFCHINGRPKQNIRVDTIFNYRFHFGLQEHVFRKVRKTHLSGSAPPVPNGCVLRT